MKKLFLSLAFVICCNCITVDLSTRCACSEFDQTLCTAAPYCAYVDGSCQDAKCSLFTQSKCTVLSSESKCKWNDSRNQCEDHDYQCSEFVSFECSLNIFSKGCYTDPTTDKCQAYGECKSAEAQSCNFFKCSYSKQDGCGDTISNVDCEGTDKETCTKWTGTGDICALNDDNQCQKRRYFSSSCSDFQNFKSLCTEPNCKLDASNQCVARTCADFQSASECYMNINIFDFTLTPCIWKSSSCQEATNEDIQNMGILCLAYTSMNYKWDSTTNKCSECSSVIDNPSYSFMKQQAEAFNYQFLVTISTIAFLALI